jgi:hypothetical protein
MLSLRSALLVSAALAAWPSPASARDAGDELFPEPVAAARRSPSPGRPRAATELVLGPTARVGRRGQLSWSATDILVNRVSYTPRAHLQLEVEALLPVLYVGVFPRVKLATSLGGGWHGALQLHGGVFWPYKEVEAIQSLFNARFALYGGGPLLTYATPRLTLNLAVPLYGVRLGQQEFAFRFQGTTPVKLTRTYFEDHFLAVPSVGASLRLGRFSLELEAHVPLSPSYDGSGKLWLIVYGGGISIRQLRLALHFLIPACAGAGELLRYLPLGVPLLSSRLAW